MLRGHCICGNRSNIWVEEEDVKKVKNLQQKNIKEVNMEIKVKKWVDKEESGKDLDKNEDLDKNHDLDENKGLDKNKGTSKDVGNNKLVKKIQLLLMLLLLIIFHHLIYIET